jgi:mono/diheme cytochrome c family protein
MKSSVAVLIIGACVAAAAEPQNSHSVWDGVYTAEQATRGRALYFTHCANCHGQQLEGADTAPALTGSAFTADWDGLTVGDLFDRIRVTMPANRPGSLPRPEIADILAFMLGANQFPSGDTELPREVQVLKQIQFKAEKPK